jgi:hypothetical protein
MFIRHRKTKYQKKNFEKKKKKKETREKLAKKKGRRITVDYCCYPQCFVCGGTVIPPHSLEYVVIYTHILNGCLR